MTIRRYGARYKDEHGRLIKPAWCHWTSEGTVQMFGTPIHGPFYYIAVYFRGAELGIVSTVEGAIEDIRLGKYDDATGIKLSLLNIPEDPNKWNGFPVEPYYYIPYD
jgi:hypothetical protein